MPCHARRAPRDARRAGAGGIHVNHFALRDADSAKPGLFHRFGLTTDDYAPKPAFHTMKRLVERFSA